MVTATSNQPEEPLDTTVRLTTPERIVFEYPLAGPFRRFFAYFIDLILLVFLIVVGALGSLIFFGTLGSAGAGLGAWFVATFALVWGYGAFCEGVFNGQTLGKRLTGIRVISAEGIPISGAQALLRNIVGVMDGFFPFLVLVGMWTMVLYLVSLSSMFATRRFQRLGDLAAGTMVVVEQRPRRSGVTRVKDQAVIALLPWLPLRIDAGSQLARALSDYVWRRGRFSRLRRESIAEDLARPLRKRYRLPENTPADTVLCAVYHRVFVGD